MVPSLLYFAVRTVAKSVMGKVGFSLSLSFVSTLSFQSLELTCRVLQKATGTSPDAKAQSVLGNVVYGNESG